MGARCSAGSCREQEGATKWVLGKPCKPAQPQMHHIALPAAPLLLLSPLLQIMTGDVSDVPAIISSKGGLKYAGADVDAMRAVGKAYQDRSLQEFQATLEASTARAQHARHSMHSIQGLLLSVSL